MKIDKGYHIIDKMSLGRKEYSLKAFIQDEDLYVPMIIFGINGIYVKKYTKQEVRDLIKVIAGDWINDLVTEKMAHITSTAASFKEDLLDLKKVTKKEIVGFFRKIGKARKNTKIRG